MSGIGTGLKYAGTQLGSLRTPSLVALSMGIFGLVLYLPFNIGLPFYLQLAPILVLQMRDPYSVPGSLAPRPISSPSSQGSSSDGQAVMIVGIILIGLGLLFAFASADSEICALFFFIGIILVIAGAILNSSSKSKHQLDPMAFSELQKRVRQLELNQGPTTSGKMGYPHPREAELQREVVSLREGMRELEREVAKLRGEPIPSKSPEPEHEEVEEEIVVATLTEPSHEPVQAKEPASPVPTVSRETLEFPLEMPCPGCKVNLRIHGVGRHRCPACSTMVKVDERGRLVEKDLYQTREELTRELEWEEEEEIVKPPIPRDRQISKPSGPRPKVPPTRYPPSPRPKRDIPPGPRPDPLAIPKPIVTPSPARPPRPSTPQQPAFSPYEPRPRTDTQPPPRPIPFKPPSPTPSSGTSWRDLEQLQGSKLVQYIGALALIISAILLSQEYASESIKAFLVFLGALALIIFGEYTQRKEHHRPNMVLTGLGLVMCGFGLLSTWSYQLYNGFDLVDFGTAVLLVALSAFCNGCYGLWKASRVMQIQAITTAHVLLAGILFLEPAWFDNAGQFAFAMTLLAGATLTLSLFSGRRSIVLYGLGLNYLLALVPPLAEVDWQGWAPMTVMLTSVVLVWRYHEPDNIPSSVRQPWLAQRRIPLFFEAGLALALLATVWSPTLSYCVVALLFLPLWERSRSVWYLPLLAIGCFLHGIVAGPGETLVVELLLISLSVGVTLRQSSLMLHNGWLATAAAIGLLALLNKPSGFTPLGPWIPLAYLLATVWLIRSQLRLHGELILVGLTPWVMLVSLGDHDFSPYLFILYCGAFLLVVLYQARIMPRRAPPPLWLVPLGLVGLPGSTDNGWNGPFRAFCRGIRGLAPIRSTSGPGHYPLPSSRQPGPGGFRALDRLCGRPHRPGPKRTVVPKPGGRCGGGAQTLPRDRDPAGPHGYPQHWPQCPGHWSDPPMGPPGLVPDIHRCPQQRPACGHTLVGPGIPLLPDPISLARPPSMASGPGRTLVVAGHSDLSGHLGDLLLPSFIDPAESGLDNRTTRLAWTGNSPSKHAVARSLGLLQRLCCSGGG